MTNFIIKSFEKTKNFGRNLFNNLNNEEKIYTNNPSQEYLFMGGSKDGHFMTIPDNQWRILVPEFMGGGREVYNKVILLTPKTRLAVYVNENMPELDILDVLVQNYHKK